MDIPKQRAFLASRRVAPAGQHHERITAPLLGLLGMSGDNDSELVYVNSNTPSSGVVCGVQGSGKSHTVSCILENALLVDDRLATSQNHLQDFFHFDEEDGDRACEAAYLGTSLDDSDNGGHGRRITVLASAINIANRQRTYGSLKNVNVQPLLLGEADITAHRLLALMGWSEENADKLPLYMHTILQIVREMGAEAFSYSDFKERVAAEKFDKKQSLMLGHRLRILDGFVSPKSRAIKSYFAPGEMVLVDLTDPFLDGAMASILFDIVLSSFMGWKSSSGKIVVLDEAHKYLTNNESSRLNRSIASIIRQQRHLATRVVIATQEPTVVPSTILDLSSFIMCHRFSSPSWCSHLAKHVSTDDKAWFDDVVRLATGEALVFAPQAMVTKAVSPLGTRALRVAVRPRLTSDGGASIMAVTEDASRNNDNIIAVFATALGANLPRSLAPELSTLSSSVVNAPQLTSSRSGATSLRRIIPTATRIDLRFQPLVNSLRQQDAKGHSWALSSAIGYELSHLRTTKTWFKNYISDALANNIIEASIEGTTQSIRLMVSPPFIFT
ncbi:hypothetical protein BKA62DRAFT_703329 [Auriculariales sp. MPI-PUGE-AT-0066]|nr:hypothetical protein BKA62DRAFT_703329 [Auriculariales sp. MPI-PUGE-AT-0066]